MQERHRGRGGSVLWILVMALGAAAPVAAQSELAPGQGFEDLPRAGIGYVANAPDVLAGIGGFVVLDVFGGLGLYVDGKMSLSSPADESDYIDDLTASDVDGSAGMIFDRDESSWRSFNAALVRPVSPELMLYLGAGYTEDDRFSRYIDESQELGTFGYFWVRDEEESGGRLNILGGAFFRMSQSLALQFGAEMEPLGFTVGFTYSRSLR